MRSEFASRQDLKGLLVPEDRPVESKFSSLLFGTMVRGPWIADLLALAARLYAGITIASAGFDKLPTPDWMADQVTQIGFPAPAFFATLACLTEFVGGILLAFGFLSRPSAFLLAFTMGAASFGFHRLAPITGMHIAQGYVWLFAMFLVVGGGRLSVDGLIRRLQSRAGPKRTLVPLIGAPVLIAASGYGLYRELFLEPRPPATAADTAIDAVSLAGTFNDWDLATTPMNRVDDAWIAEVAIDQPGPIQFKFAANNSWDLNLGSESSEALTIPASGQGVPGADNIVVVIPTPGSYRFRVETETYAFAVSALREGAD
jgi:putative oxidoreductase